jgi:hypothetical protein
MIPPMIVVLMGFSLIQVLPLFKQPAWRTTSHRRRPAPPPFARPAWLRGRAAARALVAQKGRAVVTAADRLHEITSFDRSLHDRASRWLLR